LKLPSFTKATNPELKFSAGSLKSSEAKLGRSKVRPR
jgi:hypothetical protein